MEPRPYVRGIGFTKRLLVYPDRIEAQARHPLYYSWETMCRFGVGESLKATLYAQSAETWPAIPKPTQAQKLGQPLPNPGRLNLS